MCGFLVSENNNVNNTFIRRRGPDHTNSSRHFGYQFTHHLLSVTGEFTPQPFVEEDIVCLYNGEIYNHRYEHTDGEVLIPLYKAHGVDFVKKLDGEFAIALYDFANKTAVFCTDPFGTKPLWQNGTHVGSYHSGVGGRRVPPNTRIVVDLETGAEKRDPVHAFDFDNQHKDSYNDWCSAFEKAVKKRAKPECFIALSAGFDSGAIDCVLSKIDVPYKTYSIVGRENMEILTARIRNGEVYDLEPETIEAMARFIRTNTEPYTYQVTAHGEPITMELFDDQAAVGHAYIYQHATAEKRKVSLSGQGADEIMSDYCKWPHVTELNGHYPERLKEWRNFRGNYQTAYLTKEEYIAGTFGIETRYPFLDTTVVQEFLWLTSELKNRHYKAPLHEFLSRNNYPFEPDAKTGFSIERECVP